MNLSAKLSIGIGKFNEDRHSVVGADLKLFLLHSAAAPCEIDTYTIVPASAFSWDWKSPKHVTFTEITNA